MRSVHKAWGTSRPALYPEMVKTPNKELTPARKDVVYLSVLFGSSSTFLMYFAGWTPALTVTALGLGTAWAALRPVSDDAIVDQWTDEFRPAVVRGFLKWSAVICAGSVVAIQLVTRMS